MKILVVAPHPDDEVLGSGGTLLRYKSEGNSIAWLIVTGITADFGWSSDKIVERDLEIEKVTKFFNFDVVYNLKLPTTNSSYKNFFSCLDVFLLLSFVKISSCLSCDITGILRISFIYCWISSVLLRMDFFMDLVFKLYV